MAHENDAALACQAHPDDCPNGPEPHEYVPDADGVLVMMCCRQPWEEPWITAG